MKKKLSLLLALTLCLSAACAAEGEAPTLSENPVQMQSAAAKAESETETPKPETEAPKTETETPKTETETPKTETTTPGTETTTPGTETTTPGTETTTPGTGTETPGTTETTPPGRGTETPGTETTPPDTGTETPGAETPAADDGIVTLQEIDPSAVPEVIEGWTLNDKDEKLVSGKLETLFAGEEALRVAVSTKEIVKIENFPLTRLQKLTLLADKEIFPGENFRVVCSTSESILDEISDETILNAKPEDLITLYLWVREELPEPGEIKLQVAEENVLQGQWSAVQPVFTLSGIPENDTEHDYAAIIFDERIALMSSEFYKPEKEGVYTLRFAIMNGMGDIASRSDKYTLWLDYTLPELNIAVSESENYTMEISVSDAVSGVEAISLDGGATWQPVENGKVYAYTVKKKKTFLAGSIQLKDMAGNIAQNDSDITLDKLPSYSGGGGGGDGESKPAKQHAKGSGNTALYDAYQLSLPDVEMHALKLGGEEVEFTLDLEYEGREPGRVDLFTAELKTWKPKVTLADLSPRPDTLVIHAITRDVPKDAAYTCVWKINGGTLRKLYNSGIYYLALEAGDDVMTLPTEGFLAGTTYAQLKMQGVSTQEFNFEARMKVDPEATREGFEPDTINGIYSWRVKPELDVMVDNQSYELIKKNTPEMYCEGIYCGPMEIMDWPYGTYLQQETNIQAED